MKRRFYQMITLYTTHCPKCRVIESKLKNKNIQYEENTDVNEMIQKGFQAAPILEVDGKALGFKEANDWVNNYVGE